VRMEIDLTLNTPATMQKCTNVTLDGANTDQLITDKISIVGG